MKQRTEKVVCYVVNDGHLLVLTHLDAPIEETGVQVPAGTIKPGEAPEDAALREAAEETGVDGLRVVAKLGEADYDCSPMRFEVMHRHFLHLTVASDVGARWIAGEDDPSHGTAIHRWECWWLPLAKAHVLASGQGQLLGALWD